MTEEKRPTGKEDLIIYEAIKYLLHQADIPSSGFSRDGFIQELEERRADPGLFGANDFHQRHAPYPAEKIHKCYQEACRELIAYFDQD